MHEPPAAERGVDPDGDALELVAAGDVTAASHLLMSRHGAAVYRYCRVVLRDAARADDVQQQVFFEVFRDLPRFAGRSSVRIWLFVIARNRVLDAAKKCRRAPICVDERFAADLPDPRPLPSESIDDARLRAALIASLDDLGEATREAVLLRYQQGFTFDEMARICGEKAGTLTARVARALPVLRASIEARLDAGRGAPARARTATGRPGAARPRGARAAITELAGLSRALPSPG